MATSASLLPQPLETVPVVPPGAKTITEGSAVILYAGKDAVFYNRVQIFNRDLTMTAVRCYDKMRRAAATPRDVKKAWQRRRILESLFSAESAATAAAMSVSQQGTRLFPSPPYPLMLQSSSAGGGSNGGSSSSSDPKAAAAASVSDASVSDSLLSELPGLRVLEALSASGLRSVRYAREVPGLDHVVCNDLDPAAVASIGTNVAFNGIPPGRVQPSQADASLLMYLCRQPHLSYDVIDLDPYGTAVPFLDSAVQAIAEGGLLAVTCTDMAVLASQQHPDVCHSKYGALPVRARHCHEQALRIVLAAVEAAANKYGRTVTPLLSVSVDFYVRLFMTVHTSADAANTSAARLSHLYQCTGCDSFWLQPKGSAGVMNKHQRRQQAHAHGQAAAGSTNSDSNSGSSSSSDAHEGGVDNDDAAAAGGVPERKRARLDNEQQQQQAQHHDMEEEEEEEQAKTAGNAADGSGNSVAAAASSSSSSSSLSSSSSSSSADARGKGKGSRRNKDGSGGGSKKVHAGHAPAFFTPGGACPHCGRPVQMGGPVWSAPIHDASFASAVLEEATQAFGSDGMGRPGASEAPYRYYDLHDNSSSSHGSGSGSMRVIPRPEHDAGSNDVETVAMSRRRLQGVLRCIAAEVNDAPLYYELALLSSRVHVTCPPLPQAMAALMSAGYRVSGSHAIMGAIKTDAPPDVVWGLMSAWEQQPGHGAPEKHKSLVTAGGDGLPSVTARLLASGSAFASRLPSPFSFTVTPAALAELDRQKAGGPRYVPNPGAQWGPGSRASAAKAEAKAEAAAKLKGAS